MKLLSARIDELEAQLHQQSRLDELESRLQAVELTMPAELRTLSLDDIRRAIQEDPYTRFEVLVSWAKHGVQFSSGQVVRADQTPRVVDYCMHGLKLGVPRNQEAYLNRLRAETQARQAEAKAAAEAAKLAAEALQARAEMLQSVEDANE